MQETKDSWTLILEGYRGSKAHGTYVPPEDPNSVDDIDYIGVFIMPLRYYLGFDSYHHKREVIESFSDGVDKVHYELRKFMSLALGCNPNVLSLLYNRPQDYTVLTPEGQLLIDHRNLFLSKKRIFDAFGGYARGQFKRMTHHNYEGYMGAKRKALVDKYGYDCKNAGHCIRLLKLGIELLETGSMRIYREDDRQLLIDIKTGKYTLQEVQKMAEGLFERLEQAFHRSILPDENDMKAAESLMINLIIGQSQLR